MNSDLLAIDQACEKLYNPSSQQQRSEAERALASHFEYIPGPVISPSYSPPSSSSSPSSTNSIGKCEQIISLTSSPFTMMYITNHLKNLITLQCFPVEVLLGLKNFVLQYLSTRVDLPPFVISNFTQLFAFLTKLGWLDHEGFKNVIDQVNDFLQASLGHVVIGLSLLNALVVEMNTPTAYLKTQSRHRKASTSFRDSALLSIFKLSLELLKKNTDDEMGMKACEDILLLSRNCLAFDFINTSPDEASDDISSIQIPSAWKSIILEESNIELYFNLYNQSTDSQSALAMDCISMIVSVRRSLFNTGSEKNKFLDVILGRTNEILKSEHGFGESSNYHAFCRMVAKLKGVNQLSELIENSSYTTWIELVFQFTIKSLQSVPWPSNSIYYLMTFWGKMMSSVSVNGNLSTHERLRVMAGEITIAFIKSRISTLDVTDDENDVFMEDESEFVNILELLAGIARLSYNESCTFIIRLFDSFASEYKNTLPNRRIELKFSLCVYIIGAFIWARPPISNSDDDEILDGEMSCKVIQLMGVNQNIVAQNPLQYGNERLDLSLLYFFQMFRKSYVGDQSLMASAVYSKLSETFQLTSIPMILDIIAQKLASNLKYWSGNNNIIKKSLIFLSDVASGYTSVKLFRKTDTATLMLSNHHSSEFFPFLNVAENLKCRSQFFATLGRVLLASDENAEIEFYEFVAPFTSILNELHSLNDISMFQSDSVRKVLDGLFRDLRGFSSSFQSKKSFILFFDWIFPYSDIILKGITANYDNSVSLSLLKFWNELVQNKCQRLNFDISSAGGILLFRETSNILKAYGGNILNKCVTDESRKWQDRYKGITLCLNILRWSFSGKYVSFGVFALYKDDSLYNALEIIFKLIVSVPFDDIMTFPKLTSSFFNLFQVFSSEQMLRLQSMDPKVFLYFMRGVASGLSSPDPSVSSQSAISIDSIYSHIVTRKILLNSIAKSSALNTSTGGDFLIESLTEFPTVATTLMSSILELLLFQDHATQWSLTRPLLPLILLNKDYYDYYCNTLIRAQPSEKQENVANLVEGIMKDVEFNITPKNRDKLTSQLINFRRDITSKFITLVIPVELHSEK